MEAKLYSLLPKILEKKDSSYQTVEELSCVLNEATEKKDIKNIALTGPFGSGKSSILKTLRQNYRIFEYLPISLATLQADEQETDENLDDKQREARIENLNRKIEYSILQQLIYREKASTVPNSRFRRIAHIDKYNQCKYAFFCIGCLLAFIIAFEPAWLRIESLYNTFNFGSANIWFDVFAVGYLLFALYEIIKYIIKSYSNSKLNKLNLKDGEIEMIENNSIFNKHLDEILYFFQVTKYNVVIIEDLDRFGTSNIFLKLRELNQLINESKVVEQHVVFLYAIKDDVFVDEERTKFFDYITTVIPVINPSNSRVKLKAALFERGFKENEITDGDLADMAFFIQDMRILTNIANEYYQYRQKLCTGNGQKLNYTKLLAMIVYKNYHPKDFAQLHRRAGKVYQCISLKSKFVQKALEVINTSEKTLEEDYKLYLNNSHLKERDLRLMFLYKLKDRINSKMLSIYVNDQYYSFDAIAEDSNLFNSLLSNNHIMFQYYYGYSTSNTQVNVNYKEIDNALDFTKRISLLKEAEKAFSNRKDMLQKEKLKIKSLTLKSLISKYSLGTCELYTELELSPMMDVFIRRGFIDEEYYDYISYFYEGMVSLADRELLLSIKREIKQDYSYHIDKIQNFVKELQPYMFEHDAILNNDILNYLAKENRQFNDFFNLIMCRLEKESAPLNFLAQYYILGKAPQQVFIHFINWDRTKSWDSIDLWNNETEKATLKEGWLKFCGQLDNKQCVWLSRNFNFISSRVNNIELGRCKQIIKECSFVNMNNEIPELLQCAIENCSYVINTENLCLIASFLHPNNSTISDTNLNLSRIKSTGNQIFIDYIESNITQALPCFSKICKDESSDNLLFVLNSEKLSEEQKIQYLNGQQNLLENCTGIDDNFITLAYRLYLIKPTWDNVVIYFNNENKSSEILFKYVDQFAKKLGEEKMVEDDNYQNIFAILFGCNKLSFEAYALILNSFSLASFNGNDALTKLESKRLNLLLEKGKLPFNNSNTAIIKKTSIYIDYLLYYSNYFFENREASYFINIDVAQHILSSNKFTNNQKKELIILIPENIMLSSQPLADIIIEILIATDYSVLNRNILKELIKNAQNIKKKVRLATIMIANLEHDENAIVDILNLLKGKYQVIAERTKRPVIDDTEWNKSLAVILNKVGFISSYKDDKDGIRIYPRR
ncbi:MAG: hypothetical protein ACLTNA_15045 [Bacteroides thetaiotaomicron]